MLRVDMEDWEDNHVYATYTNFAVGDSGDNYTLHIGDYKGNADILTCRLEFKIVQKNNMLVILIFSDLVFAKTVRHCTLNANSRDSVLGTQGSISAHRLSHFTISTIEACINDVKDWKIMELTKKRITAFNAFCSQKQKDDPQIGLGCKLWSREWRSMGPVEREDYQKIAKAKKETVISLRGKVREKLSKIAKRDLGLNQFPYKRLQRGEFEVEGVPSSLLPLKPLLKMNSLELKQLMDSAVSIKSRNFTLESSGGTQQQTAVLGDSGELVSGYTNKENESGNLQQITASIVHLGSTTTQVQPKPKKFHTKYLAF
ncbi:hypothetical protein C0Q70_05398 [Pomacea canaliculata]|uniref:Fibrinogen C-terminal domain-containing protein n=1 Tax=Pomacea canaliculata TaxID=400727 RepID=A0A2T7PL22_POMCA|nr:hypothetical protein C0Q70_05398 [Pomacea canaliculata]